MAGYRMTVIRERRSYHSGREDLLAVTDLRDASICQVIDRRIVEAGLTPTSGLDDQWAGMPWVTPVLGSGCLDAAGSAGFTADSFRMSVVDRISTLLEDAQDPQDSWCRTAQADTEVQLRQLVGTFTAELAGDRLAMVSADGGTSGRSLRVTDLAARAVAAAAMLNRLYYLAKARTAGPPSRTGDDLALIDEFVDEESLLAKLCNLHLTALRDEVPGLAASDGEGSLADSGPSTAGVDVSNAIVLLIKRVLAGLPGIVRRRDLRLMTEVAWYLLTTPETAMYPGWGDLLFKLMLVDDATDEASTRPWFRNLTAVGSQTRALLTHPTNASWKARTGGTRPPDAAARLGLYDAVADVLSAQAQAHSLSGNRKLPVPAAFVTSFDIELELALNDLLEFGRPIYVVLPVQVLPDERSDSAKLCWLRGRIDRDDSSERSLDRLLQLSGWEMVRPNMESGLGDPHVVHLGGCPLFTLPSWAGSPTEGTRDFLRGLAAELSDKGMLFEPGAMALTHAVVVDEYLAVQQSEAEILWTVGAAQGGTQSGSFALPALFTSSSTDNSEGSNPRYWIALGVPLDDPGVRNRVLTQLTLRNLLRKWDPSTVAESPSAHEEGVQPVGDDPDDTGGFGDALASRSPRNDSVSGSTGSDDSGGFGDVLANDEAPLPTELADVGPVADGANADLIAEKRVFISYDTTNEKSAIQLALNLRDEGIPFWFAPRDIRAGRDYNEWIAETVPVSGALVVLVSEESCASDYVYTEVEVFKAAQKHAPLIPLLLGGQPPTGRLLAALAGKQQFDFDFRARSDVRQDWATVYQILRDAVDADAPRAKPSRPAAGKLVGVVVNTRIPRDDVGILHWLGLDVVSNTPAATFTGDLHHVAAHLRAKEWDVPKGVACRIESEEPR